MEFAGVLIGEHLFQQTGGLEGFADAIIEGKSEFRCIAAFDVFSDAGLQEATGGVESVHGESGGFFVAHDGDPDGGVAEIRADFSAENGDVANAGVTEFGEDGGADDLPDH